MLTRTSSYLTTTTALRCIVGRVREVELAYGYPRSLVVSIHIFNKKKSERKKREIIYYQFINMNVPVFLVDSRSSCGEQFKNLKKNLKKLKNKPRT